MAVGHCSICGNYSDKIYPYTVEGILMEVCPNCSVFGKKERSTSQNRAIHAKLNSPEYKNKVKEFIKAEKERYAKKFSLESGERVVDDCAEIIRNIVNKNHWTNEEFAKKLNEKESYVSGFISGHVRPSIDVAKKIEKIFKVTLIEAFDNSASGTSATITRGNSKSFDRMTMGDLLKKAMEKKK